MLYLPRHVWEFANGNPDRQLVYFDCEHIHCEECLSKWWATDSSPAKKNSCPECQRVYPGMRRCSLVRAADFADSQQKKKQIAEKVAAEAAAKLQAEQTAAAAAAKLQAKKTAAAAAAKLQADKAAARPKTATKKKLSAKQSASTSTASVSSSDNNTKTALTSWTKEDAACLRTLVEAAGEGEWKTKADALRNSRGIKR